MIMKLPSVDIHQTLRPLRSTGCLQRTFLSIRHDDIKISSMAVRVLVEPTCDVTTGCDSHLRNIPGDNREIQNEFPVPRFQTLKNHHDEADDVNVGFTTLSRRFPKNHSSPGRNAYSHNASGGRDTSTSTTRPSELAGTRYGPDCRSRLLRFRNLRLFLIVISHLTGGHLSIRKKRKWVVSGALRLGSSRDPSSCDMLRAREEWQWLSTLVWIETDPQSSVKCPRYQAGLGEEGAPYTVRADVDGVLFDFDRDDGEVMNVPQIAADDRFSQVGGSPVDDEITSQLAQFNLAANIRRRLPGVWSPLNFCLLGSVYVSILCHRDDITKCKEGDGGMVY